MLKSKNPHQLDNGIVAVKSKVSRYNIMTHLQSDSL